MNSRWMKVRHLKVGGWFLALALVMGCEKSNLPRLPDSLTNGLIAQYSFSGNTLDGSGNNLTGRFSNGAGYGPDRKGRPNSALLLDGVDDYFEIPDDVRLRPAALSISVWVKPQRVPSSSHIYYKSNFTDGLNQQYGAKIKPHPTTAGIVGYDLLVDVKRDGVCDKGEIGTEAVDYEPALQLNQWFHLVSVYDGRTVKTYLNAVGRAQSETLLKPIDNCPGGSLRFGVAYANDINAFDGLIDEIRIYNRALTEVEIKALYRR